MYLQLKFFIFISLLMTIIRPTTGDDWDYHNLGSDTWSDTYPTCAKHSQSPINIKTACTEYRLFSPFKFTSAYYRTHNFSLVNNGHTIIGRYMGTDSSPLKFTGGGLIGAFEFSSFHLHWGENYKSGSEHQVNGVKYSGEIHFVHTNPETSESAVLGIFMQSNRNIHMNKSIEVRKKSKDLEKTENRTIEEWKRYFAAASNLQQTYNSVVLGLNLASLMGDNLNEFWRYTGSLTIPPCTEGLIWTVFKTPIIFTENELEGFRKNLSFAGYRDPQPLHNRTVYRNFLNKTISSISDYTCCSNGSNNLINKLFLLIPIQLICLFFK